eukprot:TRINITY_DN36599_c0_g1_i1.p4 TRINITY_DN36599_c0_g1~~TRINITY_DN36599_c0_g1_i1.p4  ORF type:complete len:277 (-),score=9.70 TRINITY_DN36599_c0_g1_i1:1431-2261(-)
MFVLSQNVFTIAYQQHQLKAGLIYPFTQIGWKRSSVKRFQAVQCSSLIGPVGDFDAIIVLAGGLCEDGSLPKWVERRLDCAADIYLAQSKEPCILLTGGGTPHKPAIVNNLGHVLHESTACGSYLQNKGIQAAKMYKEIQSYDTVGNGYFSALLHVLPAGWQTLAVITSDFHMARTKAIFDKIYRLVAQEFKNQQKWYNLSYVNVSDEGIFEQDVLQARLAKEGTSCIQFEQDMQDITCLSEFHQWLHSTHLCYAVQRQHEFGKLKQYDQKVLHSY